MLNCAELLVMNCFKKKSEQIKIMLPHIKTKTMSTYCHDSALSIWVSNEILQIRAKSWLHIANVYSVTVYIYLYMNVFAASVGIYG